ncbi:MAG: hypothetical protein ACTTIC_05770 [Helicobacteraceae bacterium]
MKSIKFISFVCALGLVAASCGSSGSGAGSNGGTGAGGTQGGETKNVEYDIYVAGKYNNKVVYWKNSVETNVTDGTTNKNVTSMAVSASGDVYLAGYSYGETGMGKALYWKNGSEFELTSENQDNKATSVVTNGDDFYISGLHKEIGGNAKSVYWKNGKGGEVVLNSEWGSSANAIAFCNGHVYTAGFIDANDGSNNTKIGYWKDSTFTTYTTLASSTFSVTSIAVDGDKVYVGGRNGNKAVYWVDGKEYNLTDGTTNGSAISSIFVSGGKVYAAGTIGAGRATYWVGDKDFNLTDSAHIGRANSITVAGGKVYVAGVNNGTPTYWIDGKDFNLTKPFDASKQGGGSQLPGGASQSPQANEDDAVSIVVVPRKK